MFTINKGLTFFFSVLFAMSLVSAETVELNAVSGTGTGPIAFEAEGATHGDDCSAPGGTASSYTGKVPNKRLYVPIADTTLTEDDTIYFVQVRVMAKADVNMNGTYDGIRIALRLGNKESRDRAIDELDTVYAYYSTVWANNPVTGNTWTWEEVCEIEAGVFTAKRRQLTFATYTVDHIQIVVTYGNGNSPQKASSVAISGTTKVGETLSGSYVYSDDEGDPEGTSLFQWYRAESANPNDTLIAAINGATSQSYILANTEEGKYVSFEVTPVASQGVLMGIPVESDLVGPVEPKQGAAPVATNVTIIGLPQVGEILKGTYTYSDADNDLEGTTTFRWLRDGTPINGAKDTTYKLTGSDLGTIITFEVTPVALTGLPKTGTPVVSAGLGPITGPTEIIKTSTLLKLNKTSGVVLLDMKGRVINQPAHIKLSKGTYIRVHKSASGKQYKKLTVVK